MHDKKRKRAAKIVQKLKKLFPHTKAALAYSSPFELYVAVVLSARNTDKKVNEVTNILFKKYRSIKDYKNSELGELEKDLGKLGLFRQKAKAIKRAARIVDEKYHGRIPDSMEELIKLPGVGRKTANILLGNLYGKVEGIAVDTHVTRLARLLGLTLEKDPNKIEKDLMQILPRKEWFDFTNLMIVYGRKYCSARCRHTNCPLRELVIS